MSADIAASRPGGQKMRGSHRLVFDVVQARHRNGFRDVTDGELQEVLERLHAPRRFDRSWISGRVAEMKAAGLLAESTAKRCSVVAGGGDGVVVRATYIPGGYRSGGRVAAAAVEGGCY